MANARGLHPPEKVADYRARGWWGEQTLDGIFADQVRARGDALAVVDPANREALLGSAAATADVARARRRGHRPRRPPPVARSRPRRRARRAARQLGRARRGLPRGLAARGRRVAAARAAARARGGRHVRASRRDGIPQLCPVRRPRPGGRRRHGARRRGLGARRHRVRPGGGDGGRADRRPRLAPGTGHGRRPRGGGGVCRGRPQRGQRRRDDLLDVGHRERAQGRAALSHGLAGRRRRDDRGAAGHGRRRAAQPLPDDQHGRHQRDVPAVAAHRVRPRAAPPLRPADVPRAGRRRARHLHVRAAGPALDAARQRGAHGDGRRQQPDAHRLRVGAAAAGDGARLAGAPRDQRHQLLRVQRGDRAAVESGRLPRPRRPGAVLPAVRRARGHVVDPGRGVDRHPARRHRDGRGRDRARAPRGAAHQRAERLRRLPPRRGAARAPSTTAATCAPATSSRSRATRGSTSATSTGRATR